MLCQFTSSWLGGCTRKTIYSKLIILCNLAFILSDHSDIHLVRTFELDISFEIEVKSFGSDNVICGPQDDKGTFIC
jgi:hypothetical protein